MDADHAVAHPMDMRVEAGRRIAILYRDGVVGPVLDWIDAGLDPDIIAVGVDRFGMASASFRACVDGETRGLPATMLHAAIDAERVARTDARELIASLLMAGASTRSRWGMRTPPWTTMSWCMDRADQVADVHGIRRMLVDHGATPWDDIRGQNLSIRNVDRVALDHFGMPDAWTWSELPGDPVAVDRILTAGLVDVDAVDDEGSGWLHRAALHPDGGPAIGILLDHGCDPEATDARGRTALFLARRDSVGPLLRHGADPSAMDDDGWVPGNAVTHARPDDVGDRIRLLLDGGASWFPPSPYHPWGTRATPHTVHGHACRVSAGVDRAVLDGHRRAAVLRASWNAVLGVTRGSDDVVVDDAEWEWIIAGCATASPDAAVRILAWLGSGRHGPS